MNTGRINTIVQGVKKIWGPFLLFCLTLVIILDIACQFINFTDSGYTIWGGSCKDYTSTNEVDECMLLQASSILAIFSAIVFAIFSGLYLFKKSAWTESLSYGVLALVTGLIFIIFQILWTVLISQQTENYGKSFKDVVGWEVLLSSTIIACIVLFFNPLVIKYIMYFGKNYSEIFEDAGSNKNVVKPIGKPQITVKEFQAFIPWNYPTK